jgi:hypothetical protein
MMSPPGLAGRDITAESTVPYASQLRQFFEWAERGGWWRPT